MAVLDALSAKGVEVLRSPRDLAAHVRHVADEGNPFVALFVSNCDVELLDPYARAASRRDAASIEEASQHGEALLIHRRYAQNAAAHKVVCELAFALASFLGVQLPHHVVRDAVSGEGYAMTPSVVTPMPQRKSRYDPRSRTQLLPDTATPVPEAGSEVDAGSGGWVQTKPGPGVAAKEPPLLPGATDWKPVGGSRVIRPHNQLRTRTVVSLVVLALVIMVGSYAGMSLVFGMPTWLGGEPEEVVAVANDFVGTWYPERYIPSESDPTGYKAQRGLVQQGNLTIAEDGTFTRDFYPDHFSGSWTVEDGTLMLTPGTNGEHFSWDEDDATPREGVLEDGKLVVTYYSGSQVVYASEEPEQQETVTLEGLWEIVEWVEQGEVRYGEDVFDEYRQNKWYSIYLDVRDDGTIEWDNQGEKRTGTWKVTGEDEGFVHIDSPKGDGTFWEGIIKIKNGELVFTFHGEDYYQVFVSIDSDPRESGELTVNK